QALGRPDLPWLGNKPEWGEAILAAKGQSEGWRLVYDPFAAFPTRITNFFSIESEGIPVIDSHHYSAAGYELWGERVQKILAAQKTLFTKAAAVPALAQAPAATAPDRQPITVSAELTRTSRVRSLAALGTYSNALVVYEYRVTEVHAGPAKPEQRLIVVQYGIRDRKLQPAATAVVKERYRLVCQDWNLVPETIHQQPMDDDLLEMDLPLWFAQQVEKQQPTAPKN
ncbi:MAG: hypothetical protein WCN98_15660, partial [Verrucomicrobiaceae bacterium]